MYPSPIQSHRRADMYVHAFGFIATVVAGGILMWQAVLNLPATLIAACSVYVLCALISNQASCAYHFLPWHHRRKLLRRIDHSAIYLSIVGTFTPILVHASTPRTLAVLALTWALALVAIWAKITNENVKGRWSTASYLALGLIGLSALPDLGNVPQNAVWLILAGSCSFAIGTVFYSRKTLPFRYSIWHSWVSIGGMMMFAGIWMVVFS